MHYILGVNGWKKSGHHPAAVLLKVDPDRDTCQIKAAVEEERFIRKKYGFDELPQNSIKHCLDEENIKPSDIRKMGVGWDYPQIADKGWNIEKYKKSLFKKIDTKNLPEIEFIDHHKSHAYSAFYPSGFKKSLIVVIDGAGETESLSIWHGYGNKVELLEKIPISASLGLLYEATNLFVGLRKEDSGKTMGLAAYGKDKYDITNNFKLTNSGFRISNEKIPEIKSNRGQSTERELLNRWVEVFEDATKTNSNKEYYYKFSKEKQRFIREVKFEEVYKNLAASVQSTVERLVLKVVKKWLGKIDTNNVCLAGGVALNCKLNGKILEREYVDKLFIQPASHDAGTALGAAIYLSSIKEVEFDNIYLGPSFDDGYIEEILKKNKISFRRVDNIPKTTAKLLEQGKIIGWFQGRMEFGPRALGNRSILADPRKSETKDKVNEFIKEREKWRPFAPSIKEGEEDKYLKNPTSSPYMILSFDVINNKKRDLKAVIHVDGTTRPQTVKKSVNNKYWHLIDEFEKLTGVPAVLNTSFNKRGEPIVCTPNQALKDFYTSGLDYLILSNFIVEK